jgi:thiol-disulfide isomerase/thioredoxin
MARAGGMPLAKSRRLRTLLAMKRLVLLLAFACTPLVRASLAEPAPLEAELVQIVAGPRVTVVHLWAPWCPNCKAEMGADGWAKFIAANPGVKFVFVNIWHKGQDAQPKLAAAGLGAQPNLVLLTHPNPSRKSDDRLRTLLGLPITWVPATWVFKDGQLRFAFNYGEIRFPLLQQLVDDSNEKWER